MARLPQPGADAGNWGDILNDYLAQSHKTDGTIKDDTIGSAQLQDNSVTATTLAPNSVTNTAIASGSITSSALSDGSVTGMKLGVDAISKSHFTSGLRTEIDAKITETAANIAYAPMSVKAEVEGRLSQTKLSSTYAPISTSLAINSQVQAMASGAPYAASPLMTTVPTIVQGTANTAALTKQITYTSSVFLWPGFVDTTGGSAVPRGRSYDNGTRATSCESTQVAFLFDGSQFDFKLKASTGLKYRLWVDGVAASSTLIPIPNETNATAIVFVDLGTSSIGRPRLIVIELENTLSPILFYGINIRPTDTILPPRPSPRFMVVGDSFGHGIGGNFYADAYSRSLGRLLGWLDTWHSFTSCPSAGLVKVASVGGNGAYISRLALDIIPNKPDVVLIQGSINDGSFVDQGLIGPALTLYVNNLKAALPNVIVVVTSPMHPANASSIHWKIRDELKSAAQALNVPFIDFIERGVFTGTGRVGAATGNGNGDLFRSSDSTHPTKEGHWMIANELAPAIASVLGLRI